MSSAISKDIKFKLLYVKYLHQSSIKKGANELMKRIFNIQFEDNQGNFVKQFKKVYTWRKLA